jgi:hypothetical protein
MNQYDFLREAIEKQIEITKTEATFHSLITNKRWFYEHTFTKDQFDEFQKWFISEYKTKFNVKLNEAKEAFQIFDLNFGFRVLGEEFEISDAELNTSLSAL